MPVRNKKTVTAMTLWEDSELRNPNLQVQGLVLKETGNRAQDEGKGDCSDRLESLWLWVHQELPPGGTIYVALGLGGS